MPMELGSAAEVASALRTMVAALPRGVAEIDSEDRGHSIRVMLRPNGSASASLEVCASKDGGMYDAVVGECLAFGDRPFDLNEVRELAQAVLDGKCREEVWRRGPWVYRWSGFVEVGADKWVSSGFVPLHWLLGAFSLRGVQYEDRRYAPFGTP
jgi:hypothetical protein